MDEAVTLTRGEIEEIFTRWNKTATDEKWDTFPPDAAVQTNYFLELAKQL